MKDDGIGMSRGTLVATPGPGTGIVEALARQLHGRIHVADALPGTAFTLIHDEIANNESQMLSA